MSCPSFEGPVFIIGMPRSGTTLLRKLLAGHPCIKLQHTETEFLPYWNSVWHRFGDLSEYHNFRRFFEHNLKLGYFKYKRGQGKLIAPDVWFGLCEAFDVSGVFEALMRHDTGAAKGYGYIWGDKSPGYITHLPLLRRLYPKAQFIHIVRDVRDYCLSIHQSWHKNMYRAAQRWSDDVSKAHRDGRKADGAYQEIQYERLIGDPKRTLRGICDHLGVAFDARMLAFSKPVQERGGASGVSEVVGDNSSKYVRLLRQETRGEIEKLSASTLLECGYRVDFPGPTVRLSAARMLGYRLADGYNLVRVRRGGRGVWKSVRLYWSHAKSKR